MSIHDNPDAPDTARIASLAAEIERSEAKKEYRRGLVALVAAQLHGQPLTVPDSTRRSFIVSRAETLMNEIEDAMTWRFPTT